MNLKRYGQAPMDLVECLLVSELTLLDIFPDAGAYGEFQIIQESHPKDQISQKCLTERKQRLGLSQDLKAETECLTKPCSHSYSVFL